MKILLLIVLLTLAVAGTAVLGKVLRGRNKRLLLAGAHGIDCNLSEAFGISVLCSGIDAPERIDALLASEYARFEVIAVLDAAGYPEEFARLTARYRMIRVEWPGSSEFPQVRIRSLWRSRRRTCRRFVLVDRPMFGEVPQLLSSGSPERAGRLADWHAAASVAAYDYLLPLAGAVTLLPDAVTRLVAELGEYPAGRIGWVRSRVGVPVQLVHREVLLDAGGFGSLRRHRIPRAARRTLWEPLACREAGSQKRHGRWLRMGLAAAFVAAGCTAAAGWWIGAAVAATAAWLAATAICTRQAVLRMSGGRCRAIILPGMFRFS